MDTQYTIMPSSIVWFEEIAGTRRAVVKQLETLSRMGVVLTQINSFHQGHHRRPRPRSQKMALNERLEGVEDLRLFTSNVHDPPMALNAVETNNRLFGPYARKLNSDDLETYTLFATKLAKWLSDARAYYSDARPQIVNLLKIAQKTLRRNIKSDADPNSSFHISSCIDHPMVAPYAQLLKTVNPHKERFNDDQQPQLYKPELTDDTMNTIRTIANVENAKANLAHSPSATSSEDPPLRNTSIEGIKTKPPKKKKRPTFGIETLIQADIQDLKKRETQQSSPDFVEGSEMILDEVPLGVGERRLNGMDLDAATIVTDNQLPLQSNDVNAFVDIDMLEETRNISCNLKDDITNSPHPVVHGWEAIEEPVQLLVADDAARSPTGDDLPTIHPWDGAQARNGNTTQSYTNLHTVSPDVPFKEPVPPSIHSDASGDERPGSELQLTTNFAAGQGQCLSGSSSESVSQGPSLSHVFAANTRTLLVYEGVRGKQMRFKISFNIPEDQFRDIARWNKRKDPTEDLSSCICASLACYSRTSLLSGQQRFEDLSDLPITWPMTGSLSMLVMYKGQMTAFPLSPPFKAGPNGLVDMSEYILLGENVVEFDQLDDLSAHVFVLRLHPPTGAQLEQAEQRRRKNKAWDEWLGKMAEPMSVASVLLTRGRLSLPQLVRISGYKLRTVLSSVLVLIQHNIFWHATTDEDGEVLEVNVDECLMRLRFGAFVYQADLQFGSAASEVVQTILDHGKLRPPDILSHLGAYEPKAITQYNQIIYKLVSSSYLKPATVLSHISPRDKRIQYETEEKSKIVGFPTAKEIREAKEVAEARLRREEEEAEQIGLKRKSETTSHRPSKRKIVEESILEDNVYFRVNFDKFSVHIRNSVGRGLIVNAANERYNADAALVLQATLKLTEQSQKNVNEIRTEPVSLANISLQLSDHDLTSGLIFSSRKKNNPACIKDYLGMLSAADNPTPAGRAGSFISFSSSKVQIEFELIGRRLRRRVLESVARDRHGAEGVRILRLLMDTGKMDEKQVSKTTMMAPKDVRPLLSALAADSLVSTQEVPKSADRNPTRTFYLWYVDLHKAYSVILGNLYKTLHNIGTRRRAEIEANEVRGVLEKRERSDVSRDENLLSRLERDILKEWDLKQKRLTVLEMRVEETVFILKDLQLLGINED
ncbi:hypothetical protein H0H93_006033 [Arthromyces matolae]|nr:hypothetical protein H0H93_006033 [Arthromyces matolae]